MTGRGIGLKIARALCEMRAMHRAAALVIGDTERARVGATLRYLRRCREARAAGYPVTYTTDPAWLVAMAINRRAGWPDDPSTCRGSCQPLPDGRYPPRADGDREYRHLRLLAGRVNTPRLIVRANEADPRTRRMLDERSPGRLLQAWEE